MKKLLWGLVALAGLAGFVHSQSEIRVITCPVPPNREVLDRLSLDVAWRTRIKLQNGRDGLFSVQIIPAKAGPEILVQTLMGAVVLLNAETGDVKWRMPIEGTVLAAAGYNTNSIFVARGSQCFVLNRKTGMHRVYSTRPGDPEPTMGFRIPATPSAPLTADDVSLFVAMGQRITAYTHPEFESALEEVEKMRVKRAWEAGKEADKEPIDLTKLKAEELEKLKSAYGKIKEQAAGPKIEPSKGNSLQPAEMWSYYTRTTAIQQAPLTTYNQVNVITHSGSFLALSRFESFLRFEFKTLGGVLAPMGQYDLTAYIGSDDYNLYALEMHANRIIWRFSAEGPIDRQPVVTDRDIYVTADRIGMYHLVRETGEALWRNSRADQFLGANPKFVYALDRTGNLLILDALRGTTMAAWDARDWTLGLSNEWTDRCYLAAQDGQIMCLRHRDLPEPMKNRTMLVVRREEAKKAVEVKKEDMEKKDDEKKVDKKDEKKKVDDKKDDKKADKKDDKKGDKKDDKKDAKKDADEKMSRIEIRRPKAIVTRWDEWNRAVLDAVRRDETSWALT
jgi:outer membrane protein assembly factor BamB